MSVNTSRDTVHPPAEAGSPQTGSSELGVEPTVNQAASVPEPAVKQVAGCCGGSATGAVDTGSAEWGYSDHRDDYLRRLRRIEGQVRGLQRMVEEDQYCIDILTQISAATKALESTALKLLNEHLAHCVSHAIEVGGVEAEEKIEEAQAAITRLVRS